MSSVIVRSISISGSSTPSSSNYQYCIYYCTVCKWLDSRADDQGKGKDSQGKGKEKEKEKEQEEQEEEPEQEEEEGEEEEDEEEKYVICVHILECACVDLHPLIPNRREHSSYLGSRWYSFFLGHGTT
jgi:hypothetical protein